MIAHITNKNGRSVRVITECTPKFFKDIPLYRHFYSGNKLYYKVVQYDKELAIPEGTFNKVYFSPKTKVYLVKGVFRINEK